MKGISFTGPMVRAIWERRKSVTRRPIRPQPEGALKWNDPNGGWFDLPGDFYRAPYRPGEVVYVRETWCPQMNIFGQANMERTPFYRADDESLPVGHKWKSPRFMPAWAARLHLEIISVRPERLADITEEEAIKEGAEWRDYGRDEYGRPLPGWAMDHPRPSMNCLTTARMAFANYVNRIYGGEKWNLKPSNMWASNPFVWRIEFKERWRA